MQTRLPAALALAAVLSAGCSAKIDPDIPKYQPRRIGTPRIAVETVARNMPAIIGAGTLTVFALPVTDVTVRRGAGPTQVMYAIKRTVEAAGYVTLDAFEAPDETPVFAAEMRTIAYKNYTWLFPLLITWGRMSLEVSLSHRHSPVAFWKRSYSGGSALANLFPFPPDSFSPVVSWSLEKILRQLTGDVKSTAFSEALVRAAEDAAQQNPR